MDGFDTRFTLEHSDVDGFGSALVIPVPDAKRKIGSTIEVQIAYVTAPAASACQWLPKEQTSGKEYPYLFTQCQVHNLLLYAWINAHGNRHVKHTQSEMVCMEHCGCLLPGYPCSIPVALPRLPRSKGTPMLMMGEIERGVHMHGV